METKVEVGTVYLNIRSITFLEGVITEINYDNGYAILSAIGGYTYIPLTDPAYIQILCAKRVCKRELIK